MTSNTIIDAIRTLVDPREEASDYGSGGERPAWLDTDWAALRTEVVLDGARTEVIDTGGGPERPVLLFIHGLGACWQCWLDNLVHFMPSHRCIAMDLPGFGVSEMPRAKITMKHYGILMDDLLEQLEVERAVVVGNSMGGFIGAELALSFPHRVDRLVLVAAAVLWQEYRRAKPLLTLAEASEALASRLIAEPGRAVLRRQRLRSAALTFGGIRYPHLLSREMQLELLLHAKRTDGFVPALRALATYPLRDELHRVACPTLVVWGAHDPLVSVKHASELSDVIPDAKVVVMRRTGHTPMLERPRRFNALLEEWLASGEIPTEGTSPEERAGAFSR